MDIEDNGDNLSAFLILARQSYKPCPRGVYGHTYTPRGVARRGGALGARAPHSDQRTPPYSTKIHDAHLCFYSETTLSSRSSRQKVDAMKWNASCAIAKRYYAYILHDCLCVSNSSGRSEVILAP